MSFLILKNVAVNLSSISAANSKASSPGEQKVPFLLDVLLVGAALCLAGFGLVMVYSTTAIVAQEKFGDSLFFAKRQAVAALLGIGALLLARRVKLETLHKLSVVGFPVAILLVALPFIPGLGDSAGGARRWIVLGPLRFQPAELAKVSFVIFMAGYFQRHEQTLARFSRGVFTPFILFLPIGVLLLAQPDFGSAAVLVLVIICMGALAGVRLSFVGVAGVGLAVLAGLLIIISPYRMQRVVGFLAPWSDASGRGYQLIQSLIAVGMGGVTGVGLGASQQKLFYLPAAPTDFIFAVVAEELGFVGALALLLAFLVVLWRGIRLAAMVADNTFHFSLAVGLTSLLVVPALLNIGVVTGMLPTKGLVLPFVGYGGTSLVVCLMIVGLMLAIHRSFFLKRV